jgi:hypothetical protein
MKWENGSRPRLARAASAFAAALAVACVPWFPEQYISSAADDRESAIVCVHGTLQDQRFRAGEEWEAFMYDYDRFTRWRYQYPERQVSSPTYFATFDEITVDALEGGSLRINARAWHEYRVSRTSRREEQKAPGPAAYRIVDRITETCGKAEKGRTR